MILTVPSYSHQVPFQPLWVALSQRGHKVVVVTTNPIKDPSLTNLTEIDFSSYYKIFKTIDYANLRFNSTWFDITRGPLWDALMELTKKTFEHPEVRKLYAPNSGEKFDVVLAELNVSPGLYALAHRFNAPLIGKNHNGNLLHASPIVRFVQIVSVSTGFDMLTIVPYGAE